MKQFPDMPPLWWLGSIALIYLGEWLFPSMHIKGGVFPAIYWILFWFSLGLLGWSALWFYRKETPIEPHRTPKTLIVEGPYTLTRNPIYLAFVMLTLSSALAHGSAFGVILAAVLWRVLDQRFAAPEEALLHQTFGPQAQECLAKTKRWL